MKEKKEAISGTVTGNDQHVGFRAAEKVKGARVFGVEGNPQ